MARLRGWRRALAAFAAGAFTTLALAPIDLWPLLFLTFPVLVWLLDGQWQHAESLGQRLRGAALIGWLFGFGYFLLGLYWIGFAFFVEADKFAWLMPLGVVAMPAGLALFYAAAIALAATLWRPGPSRIIALALGFIAVESLRGHILTGFPWNLLGYTLTGNAALMQSASVFGVYLLTFFAVFIFASPATLADHPKGGSWRRRALPMAAVAMLIAAGSWGYWRLGAHEIANVPGVKLRIVQANIPQKDKWKPESRKWIFERYLRLSRGTGTSLEQDGITHLIWPESALPFLFRLDNRVANADAGIALADLLPEGTQLILGGERATTRPGADGKREIAAVYNSLFVLDGRANVLATYDKVHLVPFGEYLPFQSTLESIGLRQLTHLPGGFSSGDQPHSVAAPGLPPFRPLICYEIIFPQEVAGTTRTAWMLNITNDAWFGKTAGPHQHFQQARVRAVEQGLPVVRAANTGISAIIDPLGRVRELLPLHVAATIDAALPAPLPPTLYVRFGSIMTLLILALAFTFWGIMRQFDA